MDLLEFWKRRWLIKKWLAIVSIANLNKEYKENLRLQKKFFALKKVPYDKYSRKDKIDSLSFSWIIWK